MVYRGAPLSFRAAMGGVFGGLPVAQGWPRRQIEILGVVQAGCPVGPRGCASDHGRVPGWAGRSRSKNRRIKNGMQWVCPGVREGSRL
eukprot:6197790-Pyramimonas_sp.AAC.1